MSSVWSSFHSLTTRRSNSRSHLVSPGEATRTRSTLAVKGIEGLHLPRNARRRLGAADELHQCDSVSESLVLQWAQTTLDQPSPTNPLDTATGRAPPGAVAGPRRAPAKPLRRGAAHGPVTSRLATEHPAARQHGPHPGRRPAAASRWPSCASSARPHLARHALRPRLSRHSRPLLNSPRTRRTLHQTRPASGRALCRDRGAITPLPPCNRRPEQAQSHEEADSEAGAVASRSTDPHTTRRVRSDARR